MKRSKTSRFIKTIYIDPAKWDALKSFAKTSNQKLNVLFGIGIDAVIAMGRDGVLDAQKTKSV